MAINSDPHDPNTARYGQTTLPFYRQRSSWGWVLGTLVVVIGLIALFAWNWDPEPVTTGTVQLPATATPPATVPPAAAPGPRP